jgi:clostripain
MRRHLSQLISTWVIVSLFIILLAACGSPKPVPADDQVAASVKATLDAKAAIDASVKATLSAKATIDAAVQATLNASHPQPQTEWTVMLYEDADDPILEQDMLTDLNEMERAGSSDQVNIVAQVDRYKGAFKGMGNWSTAKRFYVTQDDDLESIASQELSDLGEVNMADGQTLVDFITWAVQTYPAKRYALIMSDHGAGWPGGFSDEDSGGIGQDRIALATEIFDGDNLWLMEINRALAQARQLTGIDKFDLIGFDACLMAQIEIFTMLQQHAKYALASEETEPALGWAYTKFLNDLNRNPQMDGGTLAKAIVNGYIDKDQLIVDDRARKIFVKREFDFEGDTTAEEVAEIKRRDTTLAAIDLAAIPTVLSALDDFAAALSKVDQQSVSQARTYAQSYESVFGSDVPASYLDLDHFAQMAAQISGDSDVSASAKALSAAIATAVIAERHGPKRPGSAGIAIYFPVPELFKMEDNLGYTDVVDEFAARSQWPQFLAFHAASGVRSDSFSNSGSNKTSRATVVTPPKPLDVAPIKLSAEIARPNQPVSLRTKVTGERLAYLYTFVGRVLPEEQVLLIEDEDFLLSDKIKTVDGVSYPDWSPNGVNVNYKWDPRVYTINDGQISVTALIAPEEFGETPTYAVEGTYQFADGSPAIRARLFFQEAELTNILGYSGNGAQGALHQITPADGDQFTVLEQGFTLSQTAETEDYTRAGGTLTFGTQQLSVKTAPAPSGSYVVGIIAQDLDGNFYPQFESVFVRNSDDSSTPGFKSYANEKLGLALLYPANWTVEEHLDKDNVLFSLDAVNVLVSAARLSFPDAETAEDADRLGLQTARDLFSGEQGFETVTEEQAFVLGGYSGKTQDFRLTFESLEFYGSIVVATPKPGLTIGFVFMALEVDFDNHLAEFNAMIDSFDILISGITTEEFGPAPTGFLAITAKDNFNTDAGGILTGTGEWGHSSYANGKFSYELNADQGPIYDYYAAQELPQDFALQATASYKGSNDNAYGVIFRAVEDNKFYIFRISGDGFYLVQRADGDELTTIIDWQTSDLIKQDQLAANILTVVGHGDHYDLFINNQQVDQFDDDTYTGGSYGLIGDNFDTQDPAQFLFDEYTVGTPK